MALNNSFYDMSDDEGDRRLSEDDEPQAIEEIVEGEVEAFDDGDALDGGNDIEDLFGESGGAAADAAKKEVKEKKVRKDMGPKMNSERLKGPGGIIVVDELFKDFKMRGRGHEKDDLEQILKRMQKWTHRMYPKFAFPDCVEQIERLGSKMDIKNFMLRNRNVPIQPDVTPIRLLDEEDEANVDDPALAAFDQLVDDSPPSSPIAAPPALSDDQLKRMRLNREAAVRRRMEKIREREMLAADGITTDATIVAADGVSVPSTPNRSRTPLQDDDATEVSEHRTSVLSPPECRRTSLDDVSATMDVNDGTSVPFTLNHTRTLLDDYTPDLPTPMEVFPLSDNTINESIQTVVAPGRPGSRSKSRLSDEDEVSSDPCPSPSIKGGGSVPASQEALSSVESLLTSQADGGPKEGLPACSVESMEM